MDGEVEEDEATLAAIDRGIQAAEEGRVVSLEEARRRMREWFSKTRFDHPKRTMPETGRQPGTDGAGSTSGAGSTRDH